MPKNKSKQNNMCVGEPEEERGSAGGEHAEPAETSDHDPKNAHLMQYTPPHVKVPNHKYGDRVTKQEVRTAVEVRNQKAEKPPPLPPNSENEKRNGGAKKRCTRALLLLLLLPRNEASSRSFPTLRHCPHVQRLAPLPGTFSPFHNVDKCATELRF